MSGENNGPVAYACIVDGAWAGAFKHHDDAVELGFATGKRFDLLPLYYHSAPTIPEGWHKAINADAPKYGERVLVLTTDADGDPVHELAHFNGKLGYLGVGGKRIKPVTHWMPLPAFPKGEIA